MPANQTAPNPDLQRLVDAGFHISLEGPHLLVHRVPYVAADRKVDYCSLISTYMPHEVQAGQISDHTVYVMGGVPHRDDGVSLEAAMCNSVGEQTQAGRKVHCQMSNKPEPLGDMLRGYFHKMTHYVEKLASYVRQINPAATVRERGSFTQRDIPSVFHFPNGNSAKAGLEAYEKKLEIQRVAIIGAGGTGAYILDGLAKTPVQEIHLYDHDILTPENAYRFPGALPLDTVFGRRLKTELLVELFGHLRSGIISHPYKVTESNLNDLLPCQFAFIAVDHGPSRGLIARFLADSGIPFIDVGIGIDKVSSSLQLHARTRVTLVTPETRSLLDTLPIADDTDEAVYGNIQLSEINALNANLALIRYKQHLNFFTDECQPSVVSYRCSWNGTTLE